MGAWQATTQQVQQAKDIYQQTYGQAMPDSMVQQISSNPYVLQNFISQANTQIQQSSLQNTANTNYNNALTGLAGSSALQPNAQIQQAEQLIQNQISNPSKLDPSQVQSWEQFINQANAPLQAQSNTNLMEQYSAMGSLGGSANRSALANAAATTNSNTASQALSLAQNQQQLGLQQGQQNVSNLMGVGQNNQNLSLIPLQQQYNALAAQYGQQGQQANTMLSGNIQQNNNQQQMSQMQDLINANQPASTPWYQPLITGGLTAVGAAVGGPVGAGLGGAIGSLFSPSQNQSTPNYGSLLNVSGFGGSNGGFNNTNFNNVFGVKQGSNAANSFQSMLNV